MSSADQRQADEFFSVLHASGRHGPRVGCLRTAHGSSETPCFLPVASHGTLRSISFQQAAECGTRVVMANAWHVYRSAGPDKLRDVGGAHHFMDWDGILFTDSGGYQVFSLRDKIQIGDEGVAFADEGQSLTPERVVEMQKRVGSDVMMALDDCAPFPCDRKRAEQAVRRTTLWAEGCYRAHERMPPCYDHGQQLYGIVQGSTRPDLRKRSIEEVAQWDFGGYGIGGLSIGMPRSAIREMTVLTCEHLPFDKPRHLLGVGLPGQILEGVADGADTFDCVLPIRKGQRGVAHTSHGEVRFKHVQRGNLGDLPLDPNCDCSTCRKYSREQLRQLYRTNKPMAGKLALIHNLYFYHQVLERARAAIRQNTFPAYISEFLESWAGGHDA